MDISQSYSAVQKLLRGLPSLKGPFESPDLTTFPPTPHEAFINWLQFAINGDIKEPHSMTLSTVDEDGCPDARVLILKNLDERGWHFAIKADSPKGRQIMTNPAVALNFYWPQLGRQVRIRGKAVQLPVEDCAQDFLERPAGSKATALASRQSAILDNRATLDERFREASKKIAADPGYVSENWQVYAVGPRSVEFLQGATDRMHQRLRYETSGSGEHWIQQMLYP
ncbi:hypothetical protein E8E13_010821 [Curvularia kusanoi]|uniref:pyridoxal 5'-phosphate synthase n=1 Tax=Curvularia kusanoi TaxID=90978 RepID=A0A9P4W8F8_CURKU|nr:hypothetical protein E8E13_010821 [Curvularia kusanoi]